MMPRLSPMQAIAPSDVLARSFCTVFVLAMISGNCTALSSSPSPKADPFTSSSEEQWEPQARLPNARVEKLVAAQNRNVQAYECAEEFRFSALMRRDTVRLRLPERRLALPRVWAMDGAKYRGGPALFWKKGQRNALLRAGGAQYPDCRRPGSADDDRATPRNAFRRTPESRAVASHLRGRNRGARSYGHSHGHAVPRPRARRAPSEARRRGDGRATLHGVREQAPVKTARPVLPEDAAAGEARGVP
jgi:membrane-bound inhibitor of C-type lysozyme